MERADVAVLLVSANSLTSKFILKEEIRRLLERRKAEGLHVFPVILKACTWQRVPWLAAMQVRPRDGRALAGFEGNKRDEQLAKIADEVLTLLSAEPSQEELPPSKPQRTLPPPQPEPPTPTPPQKPQPASTPVRSRSRLWRGLGGVAFGLAVWALFFLLPFLDGWTYLIPLSVRMPLSRATAVLFALFGWMWSERQSLKHFWRRVPRAWAFVPLAGVLLLCSFQLLFVVRFRFHSGLLASEIVAPPRIEGGTCPCTKEESEADCLTSLTLEPNELARCWDGSRRTLNSMLWSLAYLLAVGGAPPGLALLWSRSREVRRPHPAAVRPAGGAAGGLFLSYSRRDREFAERLAADLTGRGIVVWADWWEMAVGDSLPRKIEESIANSAWFGIVLSPDSIDSRWVRAELDLALTMEMEGRLSILPILHEPCEIPLSLRRKVWADFTSSYEEGLEALLGGLDVASEPDPIP
jgi:TIR domain